MSDEHVERAYAILRSNTRGDLRFDEHVRSIRYVIEPGGRAVSSLMVAMLSTVDAVLFVPEYAEGALELQVTPLEFGEHDEAVEGTTASGGGLVDRWRIHHGDPPDVRWGFLDIDAAKLEGVVIDGEALRRPNPLAADEPRICRRLNRERPGDVRSLLAHYGPVAVDDPVVVAVDPLGLDVRGRFEVYRVPAIEVMHDAETALRVIDAMCEATRTEDGHRR